MIRRLTLAVACPFALWAILWIALTTQRAAWQTVGWALFAGAVVGACVAATSYLFLRSTSARWVTFLGLFLAQLGAAAVSSGGMLYLTANWPPAGHWRNLPPLPDSASQLEGPDCVYGRQFDLIVRSTTGRRFVLDRGGARQEQWLLEEPRSRPNRDGLRACSSNANGPTKRSYPAPPRIPLQIHRVRLEGADCGGDAAYLLAKDGSLWAWEVYSCALAIPGLLLGSLTITLVVTLAAFLLTIYSSEGRAWRSTHA